MAESVKVNLQWLLETSPGEEAPRGKRFVLPARFDHQDDNWTRDAWSLVIETIGSIDDRNRQSATAHFLMPNAPHEWLMNGRHFTLFEGMLAVAKAEIA